MPDQPARFAKAKADQNQRFLDITSVYDPSYLSGLRVGLTGANRGIGLSLAKELTAQGAKVVAIVRKSSPELDALKPEEVITGIEATSDEACKGLAGKVKGGKVREEFTFSSSCLAVNTKTVTKPPAPARRPHQQRRLLLRARRDDRRLQPELLRGGERMVHQTMHTLLLLLC